MSTMSVGGMYETMIYSIFIDWKILVLSDNIELIAYQKAFNISYWNLSA